MHSLEKQNKQSEKDFQIQILEKYDKTFIYAFILESS